MIFKKLFYPSLGLFSAFTPPVLLTKTDEILKFFDTYLSIIECELLHFIDAKEYFASNKFCTFRYYLHPNTYFQSDNFFERYPYLLITIGVLLLIGLIGGSSK